MAVQVSYPGVYVEEFAPGAPIAGVGTGTAAFLGTAASGPPGVPTRVQSWDAFASVFGGFPAVGPGFLAAAVYGFFRNGGTDCYVVRAATGTRASAALDSRQTGPGPAEPVLLATALIEGPPGSAVTVHATDSSRRASALSSAGDLGLHVAQATVTAVAGPTALTVDAAGGFAAGDRVTVQASGAGSPAVAVVRSVRGSSLELASALPAGAATVGASVRTADLVQGHSPGGRDAPVTPTGQAAGLAESTGGGRSGRAGPRGQPAPAPVSQQGPRP